MTRPGSLPIPPVTLTLSPLHPLTLSSSPSACGNPTSASRIRRMIRVGIGYDTHRLAPGRPLVLGGVRIEHARGLVGHSDADVVLHALTDALLGAAGLGDIGDAFPDTDPVNKDRDSAELLKATMERVGALGWRV